MSRVGTWGRCVRSGGSLLASCLWMSLPACNAGLGIGEPSIVANPDEVDAGNDSDGGKESAAFGGQTNESSVPPDGFDGIDGESGAISCVSNRCSEDAPQGDGTSSQAEG